MATDVGVGDIEIPYLDVTPGDGSTAGTLTVTAPDGTTSIPDVAAGTPSGGTVRLAAAAVTYSQAGRWLLHWTVTGTGAGAEDHTVYVAAPPTAGGPTWTPGRSRVANYVPGRTLVRANGGNSAALTFDSTTNPPGVVVDRLIADAVAWVTAATGPVHASLYEAAATCAAIYAASSVELGYPDRETQVKQTGRSVAEDLYQRAKSLRDDLVVANRATGETPVEADATLLPRWSFPTPVTWGDLDL